MGSSPSFFNLSLSRHGQGEVRGTAALALTLHPRRAPRTPPAPHPAGLGWVRGTMKETGPWSSRAPRTQ